MVNYDHDDLVDLTEGWKRASIGFAGPYGQLVYILCVGFFSPRVCDLIGGWKNFTILMLGWTLVYLYFYSIWFYDDENSDFALYVRKALP